MKIEISRYLSGDELDYHYDSNYNYGNFDSKGLFNLGEILSKIRKNLGMSRLELAEKLGITDFVLFNWERGATPPDSILTLRWITFLSVTPDAILTYYDNFGDETKRILWNIPILDTIIWHQGTLKYQYVTSKSKFTFTDFIPYDCNAGEINPYILCSDCIFFNNEQIIGYKLKEKQDSLDMVIFMYRWLSLLQEMSNPLLKTIDSSHFSYPVIIINLRKRCLEKKILYHEAINDYYLLDDNGQKMKQRSYRITHFILDEISINKTHRPLYSTKLEYIPYPIKQPKKK